MTTKRKSPSAQRVAKSATAVTVRPPAARARKDSVEISIDIDVSLSGLENSGPSFTSFDSLDSFDSFEPSGKQVANTLIPVFDVDDVARDADGEAEGGADAAAKPAASPRDVGREMYERFLDSDYPAAMALAQSVIALAPDNAMARAVLEKCQAVTANGKILVKVEPSSVLGLTIPMADLKLLPIDSRTAFFLSMLDGTSDVETLLDMTGLPSEDVLPMLQDLVGRGVLVSR